MKIELIWDTTPALKSNQIIEFEKSIDRIIKNDYTLNVTSANIKSRERESKGEEIKDIEIQGELIINLIITNKQTVQKINSEYRNKDKGTDVLTFPLSTDINIEGQSFEPAEIYISQENALENCKEHGTSYLEELSILFIHGLLHAFHFDHEAGESEKEIMLKHEKKLLSITGLKNIQPLTTYGT